jgi:hypothetical protein
MGGDKGERALLPARPPAHEAIADHCGDNDRCEAARAAAGIAPCLPSPRSRKTALPHGEPP